MAQRRVQGERRSMRRAALALSVPPLLLGGVVALAPPAHAAHVRYASPIGTAKQSCRSPERACSLEKAVNKASLGDEVAR